MRLCLTCCPTHTCNVGHSGLGVVRKTDPTKLGSSSVFRHSPSSLPAKLKRLQQPSLVPRDPFGKGGEAKQGLSAPPSFRSGAAGRSPNNNCSGLPTKRTTLQMEITSGHPPPPTPSREWALESLPPAPRFWPHTTHGKQKARLARRGVSPA